MGAKQSKKDDKTIVTSSEKAETNLPERKPQPQRIKKEAIVLSNGAEYTGEWLEDKQDGYGEMKWPNGAIYSGEWINGEKSGQGKLIAANGNVFEG